MSRRRPAVARSRCRPRRRTRRSRSRARRPRPRAALVDVVLRRRRLDERLGDAVEPVVERMPEPRDLHPAADEGEHREDRDRDGHRPRPLAVPMAAVTRFGAFADERRRLAAEDDEEQPEGVDPGQERADAGPTTKSGHAVASPLARAAARIASLEKKPANGGMPTSASEPIEEGDVGLRHRASAARPSGGCPARRRGGG